MASLTAGQWWHFLNHSVVTLKGRSWPRNKEVNKQAANHDFKLVVFTQTVLLRLSNTSIPGVATHFFQRTQCNVQLVQPNWGSSWVKYVFHKNAFPNGLNMRLSCFSRWCTERLCFYGDFWLECLFLKTESLKQPPALVLFYCQIVWNSTWQHKVTVGARVCWFSYTVTMWIMSAATFSIVTDHSTTVQLSCRGTALKILIRIILINFIWVVRLKAN